MNKFWRGFFNPLLFLGYIFMVIFLAALPVFVGYLIQGETFSVWWGVLNIVYLLCVAGGINALK